jgi:hypothetical protein
VGGAFVRELVKTGKHTITALTREDSKSIPPEGVKVVKVNYDDEASLVSALRGQQFLIITLPLNAPEDVHGKIASAAGKAGVPYVMPNAYTYPIERRDAAEESPFQQMYLARIKEVEDAGSTAVMLGCGFWYEWSLSLGNPWFGFDIKDRKVTFVDDGKRVITVSTWDQCGRAAAALLDLPESGSGPSLADFKGRFVKIHSFRVSQRDTLDSLHRVLGTTDADWDISYETVEKRRKDGAEELSNGIPTGFVKQMYANVFAADNEASDYAGHADEANSVLGLPEENLDEVTKGVVAIVKSGKSLFG